jgi:hypothetical protein
LFIRKSLTASPTCQPPRTAPGPRGSAPRRCRGLKPLSGQRTTRPDSARLTAAPLSARRRRPDRRLARAARVPTASPTAPVFRPSCRPRRRPDRLADPAAVLTGASPVDAAPRRRLRVGEPPFPRRLPCAGAEPPPAHRAAPPPSRALPVRAAMRSHCASRVARAGRARPPAPRTRAAHAASAEAVGRVAVGCASTAHVSRAPRGRRSHRALCI